MRSDNVVEISRNKIFTLQQARELLPIIYYMTKEACETVKSLENRVEAFSDKAHPSVDVLEAEISAVIDRWHHKVEKLGAKPKGLWLADFDNGEGYYCWKYPDNEINHWHGYQDGYSQRILVK